MKNINLKNEDLKKKSSVGSNFSSKISVVILIISFLIYGIVFLLNYLAINKKQKIENEVTKIEKELVGGDFAKMYSFNMKLIDLKSKIGEQGLLAQTKNIVAISKNTLPVINFLSFNVENNDSYSHYTIETVTPNFTELANQIKIYKQMENVHNFFLESVQEQEEKGVLTAKFSFDLGEYKKIEEVSKGLEENF